MNLYILTMQFVTVDFTNLFRKGCCMKARIMSAAVALLVSVSVSMAQDVTPSIGAGSKAILFTFQGLSDLGAGNFNGGIGGKYFLSSAMAVRAGIEFKTVHQEIPAPVTPSEPLGKDGSMSATKFGISVAGEYHFLPGRVSPYVGAGLGFSSESNQLKTAETGTALLPPQQTTYKNIAIDSVDVNPGIGLNVGGIVGVEFFVTKEISLGAEYQIGYAMLSRSDEEQITVNRTDKTPMGSEWTIDINAKGGLMLSIYF